MNFSCRDAFSCTVLLLWRTLLSCFSSAPLWVETWGVCQSSELNNPLVLSCSLREKSQLFHLLPQEYSSPISNSPLQGRKPHTSLTEAVWVLVGLSSAWAPGLDDCTFWHPDITASAQPAHPHQMSYHSFYHSLPWEPRCLPGILKLKKNGDSFFQVLSHGAHI